MPAFVPAFELICAASTMAVSMKTPLMQVVLMGTVVFFVFSAFLTIQAFASDMYGEDLGSKMATALYLSFR